MRLLFRGFGIGIALLAAGCKGKYVTYTKQVNLATTIAIRENQPFNKSAAINLADLAKAKADIPSSAMVKSLHITALSITWTVLPTTDASDLDVELLIQEPGSGQTIISKKKTVGTLFTDVRTTLEVLPSATVQNALNTLRNQLNDLLEGDATVTFSAGLRGTPRGGRVDLDIAPVLTLSITYLVCEKASSPLVAMSSGDCNTADPDLRRAMDERAALRTRAPLPRGGGGWVSQR